MKKLAVATATTTIAALGSLVLAPAAQADPYPRSIDTQCVAFADGTVAPSANARVRFTWTADGNVAPSGSVRFVVKRANGVIVKRGSIWKPARRDTKRVKLTFDTPGNFIVKFRTNTGPSSVFQNCKATTDTIKVRERF
jgi:hypothetical protein